MKKKCTKLAHIALIWAVICSGFGNVLCYGADGHIAVEPVFHSHCHHDEHDADHTEKANTSITDLDSCDPCMDVLIGNEIEPVRVQKSSPRDTVHVKVVLTDLLISSCSKITNGAYRRTPFFTPLKSIILLT